MSAMNVTDVVNVIGGGLSGISDAVAAVATHGLLAIEWERGWLLWAVPVVAAIAAVALVRDRARPTLRFAQGDDAPLPTGAGPIFRALSLVLMGVACVAAVVGAAGPFIRGEPDPASTEGIDIVIALDVSGSMRAADFRPKDRLYVAKQVISTHVLSRKRDRVGLVVFAGEAFTQAPLTHDRALLQTVLDGVRTGVIKDGTAIGDGLALALSRLQTSKATTKTVILLTDGDNNSGNLAPETALQLAKETQVKVYSILAGKGGRVPFPDGVDVFGAPRYVTVEMPVNPALLKRIATESGGAFFQARDSAALETSFQAILESLDKSVLDGSPPVRRPLPLSSVLALLALLAASMALVLRHTRGSVLP
jgi:Ca-activated chloride channel family protein